MRNTAPGKPDADDDEPPAALPSVRASSRTSTVLAKASSHTVSTSLAHNSSRETTASSTSTAPAAGPIPFVASADNTQPDTAEQVSQVPQAKEGFQPIASPFSSSATPTAEEGTVKHSLAPATHTSTAVSDAARPHAQPIDTVGGALQALLSQLPLEPKPLDATKPLSSATSVPATSIATTSATATSLSAPPGELLPQTRHGRVRRAPTIHADCFLAHDKIPRQRTLPKSRPRKTPLSKAVAAARMTEAVAAAKKVADAAPPQRAKAGGGSTRPSRSTPPSRSRKRKADSTDTATETADTTSTASSTKSTTPPTATTTTVPSSTTTINGRARKKPKLPTVADVRQAVKGTTIAKTGATILSAELGKHAPTSAEFLVHNTHSPLGEPQINLRHLVNHARFSSLDATTRAALTTLLPACDIGADGTVAEHIFTCNPFLSQALTEFRQHLREGLLTADAERKRKRRQRACELRRQKIPDWKKRHFEESWGDLQRKDGQEEEMQEERDAHDDGNGDMSE